MRTIQVLGTGCAKCKRLGENAEAAVKSLGIDCNVEKITNIEDIIKCGIMMTPGLVIDGKVVSTGRLLNTDEIKKLLI